MSNFSKSGYSDCSTLLVKLHQKNTAWVYSTHFTNRKDGFNFFHSAQKRQVHLMESYMRKWESPGPSQHKLSLIVSMLSEQREVWKGALIHPPSKERTVQMIRPLGLTIHDYLQFIKSSWSATLARILPWLVDTGTLPRIRPTSTEQMNKHVFCFETEIDDTKL